MSDPADTGRRYGGKTAEERRTERRGKLLDAGLELFGTVGYAATTIEMLCAATHLNPRYFYEEFGTREALLQAVFDRHSEAVLRAVAERLETAPTKPRERLEAGLRAFIDINLADPRAARINYFEMVGVSRELEARGREVLGAYADLVAAQAEAYEDASFAGPNVRLAAVAFVSATNGLIIDWLANPDQADRDEIITVLLDIFLPE